MPETVLNVLAVALHFGGGEEEGGAGNNIRISGSCDYHILISEDEFTRPSWEAPDEVQCTVRSPLQQLKGVAAVAILHAFAYIAESESFAEHFWDDDDDMDPTKGTTASIASRKEALLRTCLDILVAIPILSSHPPKSDSKGRK